MPVFFLLKTESGDFHRRFAFVFYSLIVATAIRRAVIPRLRGISAKAYASEAVTVPVTVFRRRSTVTVTTAAATAAVIAVYADIAVTVAANALKTAVPPATAVVAAVTIIATAITAATRTIEIESRITRIIHSFV